MVSKERYNPCFECLNRYGRQYSKECDEFCDYARILKIRDDNIRDLERIIINKDTKLEKLNRDLEWAYQFICKLKE